ncbi:hypothetical protein VHEMI10773 [[Torrubiella] hemipterigena]|uniref:Uncharacterized protein n=1 Tax=[Torrubiella] hemipterigena TaxID=1531966 RepID=A0A0A1TJK2_9HYPO|nr:hypothetical protein VHEMI10773 [[Torrubiella] hemipterigena]
MRRLTILAYLTYLFGLGGTTGCRLIPRSVGYAVSAILLISPFKRSFKRRLKRRLLQLLIPRMIVLATSYSPDSTTRCTILRNRCKQQTDQQRRLSRNGNRILENFTGWQHIAPLRKVHNIAVWIRKSTLHSAAWDDEIKLRLDIDNATRWNSWYRLLDNLLRYQARVKQFLVDHDRELQDDILLASEWEFIERTHRFLQPFASATLLAGGAGSTLSQSLSIMDVLLRQYENTKNFIVHRKRWIVTWSTVSTWAGLCLINTTLCQTRRQCMQRRSCLILRRDKNTLNGIGKSPGKLLPLMPLAKFG